MQHEYKQGSTYNNVLPDSCVKCGMPKHSHDIVVDFAGKRYRFENIAAMNAAGFYFI